jgi:hypothetical protein
MSIRAESASYLGKRRNMRIVEGEPNPPLTFWWILLAASFIAMLVLRYFKVI